jgi:hypothetical protein
MKVDFNNVRKQACISYDKLVRILNRSMYKEAQGEYVEGFGTIHSDTIIVNAEDVEDVLNDLRMMIGTIAMCSDGSEDVLDVYKELYPENDETKRMAELKYEE